MSAARTIRPLAPSEETYAGSEIYVVYSVRLSGQLDLKSLTWAFGALRRTFPILATHLDSVDDGHVIVEGAGELPDVAVFDDMRGQLDSAAKLWQHEALSALYVVRDGGEAIVSLAIHHSIADAQHGLAVFAELWSLYTDATGGHLTDALAHGYPQSVEALLAARGVTDAPPSSTPEESGNTPVTAAAVSTGMDREARDERQFRAVRTVRLRLTVAETSELLELGRREHVTLNGLVSGAIILTEAEVRGISPTEVVFIIGVSLRSRLIPRVSATEGTNIVGLSVCIPAHDVEANVVNLGAQVSERIRSGLADGTVMQSALQTVDMSDSGLQAQLDSLPGLVFSSYWGDVPEMRMPESLRVTDFFTTMYEKSAEVSEPGRAVGACTYVTSVFDGRLSIEIPHINEDVANERHRIDTLSSKLRGVLGSPRESESPSSVLETS